jgi:uncharacterized protein YgbK (DUF1537 family)
VESNPIKKDDLLRSLPNEWPLDLRPRIKEQLKASGTKVVVLDDDPTGTQTVHHVPVLTEWSSENLRSALEDEAPAAFVLTNSRSLPLAEARSMNSEIGRHLQEAAGKSGRRFVVVSRSDSTLRGHFPGELEALAEGLSHNFEAWIVVPFFLEGGRYTVNDTHYVDEDGWLIPAAQTEFARDRVFGYASSNLREWVEEKTNGRIPAKDVLSISIEDIRRGGPERITQRLIALQGGRVGVVNAASYRDLEVFVLALLNAEAQGRKYLYRTAASFVQVRAGLSPRLLLSRDDLALPASGGGLVMTGSYVPRTSQQLHQLLTLPEMTGIEVDVKAILDDRRREQEIQRVARTAETVLQKAKDVVIYTSRDLVTGDNAEATLSIGNRVSGALISVLNLISSTPRYLVGKGGVTASDIATKGLKVKRALVLGQILPGVPVWSLGPESRFPGIPYIVFPGNVGGPGALAEVVKRLKGGPPGPDSSSTGE